MVRVGRDRPHGIEKGILKPVLTRFSRTRASTAGNRSRKDDWPDAKTGLASRCRPAHRKRDGVGEGRLSYALQLISLAPCCRPYGRSS
jgi:hypothetical protein